MTSAARLRLAPRPFAGALGALLFGLVVLFARPARASDALAWVSPAHAAVIAWTQSGVRESLREVDPAAHVRLERGELLLIPVDAGDRAEIVGGSPAVGLGSGVGATPDAVTWLPAAPASPAHRDRREVHIPLWSNARFLVIGASPAPAAMPVRVRLAAGRSDPLSFHRFDERVAAWLMDDEPLATAPSELAPLARWLVAARAALAEAPREASSAWLLARWLEESMRTRPLVLPYFVESPVSVQSAERTRSGAAIGSAPATRREAHGAPDPACPEHPATACWRADAGQGLTIGAPDGDVVRLVLRARALGRTTVALWEGERLARVSSWDVPARASDARRWTEPQTVRLVLPVERRGARLRVLEGSVAVSAVAYRRKTDAAAWISSRKDRAAQLGLAARSRAPRQSRSAEVVALLAGAEAHADKATSEALATFARGMPESSPLRAIAFAGAMRGAGAPEALARHGGDAARAIAMLPANLRAPLARGVLEQLVSARGFTAPGEGGVVEDEGAAAWRAGAAPSPSRFEGGDPDDLAAIAALEATLIPARDGLRPAAAARADRHAWQHADAAGPRTRAREAWSSEGPWRTLHPDASARVSTTWVTPRDEAGGAHCAVRGRHGLRWTVLDEPRTPILVASPRSTHARVVLRSASDEPEAESSVRVDGISVAVHAAAGLPSVLAVAPGLRTFERASDAPVVLARIPRTGQARCASLRDAERWVQVDEAVTFVVPSPGDKTIARVLVSPDSVPAGASRRLRVLAGSGAAVEAWVRGGASGAIEIPVAEQAGSLRVEVDGPIALRAAARLREAPPTSPRVVSAPRTAQDPPSGTPELLLRIRDATRRLQAASGALRETALTERAAALEALGFSRFATLDRTAALTCTPPCGRAATSDAADGAAPDAASEGLADAEAISFSSLAPAVVPLGFVSRIPPLPMPSQRDGLRRARERLRVGDAGGALGAILPDARSSSAADALLLTVAAESTGETLMASDALERIGFAHQSGAAFAHAATLSSDVAQQQGDAFRTLRAYALAHLALERGDPARAAFARLSGAVRWSAVTRADSAAGSAVVELTGRSRAAKPLGGLVREALLDAPPDAFVLSEAEHLEMRVEPRRATMLSIEAHCTKLDAGGGACSVVPLLDGSALPCSQGAAAHASRCNIQVPPGAHRLELRPAEVEALAWVRVREGAAEAALDGRVRSRWLEVDGERPIELAFAGPTVVRLRARVDAGAARSLVPELDGQRLAGWEAGGAEDPSARRTGIAGEAGLGRLTEVSERFVSVLGSGRHTLRLHSSRGRALVDVAVSTAVGLPTPRVTLDPSPPVSNDAPRVPSAPDGRPAPEVTLDPDPGPFTVRTAAAFVNADLADSVDRTPTVAERVLGPYLELSVMPARELVEHRAWIALRGFTRIRSGPPSYGLSGSVDMAPAGWLPGALLIGRTVAQVFDEDAAFGAHGAMQAFWRIPWSADWALVPALRYDLVHVDETARDEPALDREVYSPYDASHPHYATGGLRLAWRPLVDARALLETSLRASPAFDGIDRYDVRLDADIVPGRGWAPWISASWRLSYRPVTPQRASAFVRNTWTPRVTFWRWMSFGHRVTVGAEARITLDRPAISGGPALLSGLAFLGYDFTGLRGLRDLAPREVFFRDRLEEGSGRTERRQAAEEPGWEEPP